MKLLVVIPVRGNSKGIPGKNKRLLNGKPLMAYAIENALSLKSMYDVDVVVDTESEELANIAHVYGAQVVKRPERLSGDAVTLDPVIYHAKSEMEAMNEKKYDIVITMQATSPTLKSDTLKRAVEEFLAGEYDTMISAVDDRHLSWRKESGVFRPTYEKRVNRQQLMPEYTEAGAFLITKADHVTENTRIGEKVTIFEISDREAVDIDTSEDFVLCENILKSKKVLFRADGEEMLGMGHIYRCLSIAYQMTGHEVLFVSNRVYQLGVNKIKESNFHLREIDSENELMDVIREYQPDILINDILNTSAEYMDNVCKLVPRVINFEDMGDGAGKADAVINALYSGGKHLNEYNGVEYFFLRDEFFLTKPSEYHEQVRNITVLFGGSDPCNLTGKVLPVLTSIAEKYPEIESHIITGFGYRYKNDIKNDTEHHIYIHNDVKQVSAYMKNADIAITSQGRTIYELACMGVPSVVMAQNEREQSHEFADLCNGYINLGMGKNVDEKTLFSTLDWLIHTPNVRKQMHDLMLSKDFKSGRERVLKLILDE
jgi:CMP-N-acetylneuraminic acid synthetase/spore coat polysaccharide biosynthesis predicted glycosyltransferase SpsG